MKVSVIVPVYKVEKYLHRCLDSIINQTYTNLEIILVDDGSPDNCPVICDEYVKKDKRVKVIHKQNGGQASARNAGLEIATGDYVGFVDSDDWIELNMYEKLVSVAEETGADVVKCCFDETDLVKHNKCLLENRTYVGKNEGDLFDVCHGGAIWSSVCNDLYKREVALKVRFPEGFTKEDNYYSSMAVYYSYKICTVRACLYNYFRNRTGTMANGDKRPMDRIFTRIFLKRDLEKLGFKSKMLDRLIAKDIHHYICRDNRLVRVISISYDLYDFVTTNLDLRRLIKLHCSMWWKGISIR